MNTLNTSLQQVPAIIKRYKNSMDEKSVLNFGCGKGFKKVHDYLNKSFIYHYDKYLDTIYYDDDDHVLATNEWIDIDIQDYDIVVLANVLNVIKDYKEIEETLDKIKSVCNNATTVYISVYEGDRKGEGKETTKGYQRNQKAVKYKEVIEKYFSSVERKSNNYICKIKGN